MSYPIVNYLAGIKSKQPWLVMNAANTFSISGSNNFAISHFYSFKAKNSEEQIFAIPDGCIDILFDCDSRQPCAEVFGTPMEAMNIELKKNHRYFGVRFKSGIMPDLLNISAKDLVAHHYNLIDLIPNAERMIETIINAADFTEKTALFETFFYGEEVRQPSQLTSFILSKIFDSHGTIRIQELENLTDYNVRTIQRQFQEDVGMSPKAFCRIIRLQSAVYDINHNDAVNFTDLAYDLGFSDQSHFLREFRKLINTTPLDYLTRVKDQTYLERIQYL